MEGSPLLPASPSAGLSPFHMTGGPVLPALVAASGERAGVRFLEFFASTIRNPHTRRAYARAVSEFLGWCEDHGVVSIAAVQPLHVATWIEGRTRAQSAPTVKQQLAAIRHLFDWLVMGQIVPLNPAASVRGPAHSVRKGKTPVLDPAEARTAAGQHRRQHADRTARPGADRAHGLQFWANWRSVFAMRVEDVFVRKIAGSG